MNDTLIAPVPPLESYDKETADLVQWIVEHEKEIKDNRAWVEFKKDNPYTVCPDCNKKLKWCQCP